MNAIVRIVKLHNHARDKIWNSVTTIPPEQKLFTWLPRTDDTWNKRIHALDDRYTEWKNRTRPMMLKVMLVMLMLCAMSLFLDMLYRMVRLP